MKKMDMGGTYRCPKCTAVVRRWVKWDGTFEHLCVIHETRKRCSDKVFCNGLAEFEGYDWPEGVAAVPIPTPAQIKASYRLWPK